LLRRTLVRSVFLFNNVEPLRGSNKKIFHLIPGLKPGATNILSLRDKDSFNKLM